MSQVVFPDVSVYLDVLSTPLSSADLANISAPTAGVPRIDNLAGGDCLISFQTSRGRQNAQSHFDSGTLSIEFDNKTGFLDPTYTSGPFYGHLGVGNHISVYAAYGGSPTALWSGYVTSFSPQYDYTGGERMVITATDMFNILALQAWPLRTTLAPVTADALIRDILSDCGFASGFLAAADVGASLVQAPLDDPANPGQTTNALGVMQAAAEDSEGGLLYVNPNGTLRFYNRYKRPQQAGATIQTFTDTGSGAGLLDYEQDVAPVMDDSLLVNAMQVTDANGVTYTYQDAASIARYGPRVNSLSNLMSAPNEGYDLAAFTVQQQKDARLRVDQVTLRPVFAFLASWATVIPLDDFGAESVTLIRTAPSGNVITQDSFIERIQHSFDGIEWTITYGLSARTNTITANWLLLNDASLGKLNTGALGF